MKPSLEGDSQTIEIHTDANTNWIGFLIINILLTLPVGFEPARQKYIASQKPVTLPTELSGL